MSEWTKPSDRLPEDGRMVRVRLVGGQVVKRVEFAAGRFWKVRKGNGGHAYEVEAWGEIDTPKRSRDERSESTD